MKPTADKCDPQDDVQDALAALEAGLDDAPGPARAYRRYTTEEKATLFDAMLEQRYRGKLSWDEIAAAQGVARSTMRTWRQTDEWRLADARWRRIVREETRSDAALLGPEALQVLATLMHTARSEFVQYSAAAKIVDVVGIGDEVEEAKVDQAAELTKFLAQQQQGRERRAKMHAAAGIAPGTDLLALPVLPGGMLPEPIMRLTEAMAAERRHEQEAVEAAFRAVTAPGAPASPAADDPSGEA